jgi:hypothetical protein
MSVVGLGRSRPGKFGNAVLHTRHRNGDPHQTPLWISAFSTDLSLLISKGQLKGRVTHRPIRFQERFVVVKVLMPSFAHFTVLQDRIRDHWAYNLGSADPFLMVLHYYGANKRYRGMIEKISAGEQRFEVMKQVDLRLRVVMERERGSVVKGQDSPFAPTDMDARSFGTDWFRANQLMDKTHNKHRDKVKQWRRTRSMKQGL